MAVTLRLKRRTTGAPGAPASLTAAEVAFNEVDNTLYYGKGNSGGAATSIIPIAGPGMASATLPIMDSVAAIGTGVTWARADHVHASDTARLAHTRVGTDVSFDLNTITGTGGGPFTGYQGTHSLTNQAAGQNFPAGSGNVGALLTLDGSNAGWASQLFLGVGLWARWSIGQGLFNAWAPVMLASGATMTGSLTMSGATDITLARDPTAALQAATKQYVDARPVTVATVAALRALNTAAATVIAQGYQAANDGGGGTYVRGSAGTDNGGSIIVSANGTYYLQTYGLPLSVTQFGARGDGVTDDQVAIQNCINAVQAAGGGVVWFPARTFAHGTTLYVTQSGTRLIGSGYDGEHDYSPAWPSNSNTRAVTALLWIGANGGTQIQVAPLSNNDNGGALGGCAVLNMNLFAGTFPYTSAAATGVYAAAVKDSEFSFFALEHTLAGLYFGCLNRNAAWNNGVSFCRVPYLGYRGVAAGSGAALRMDGISGVGNAYNNLFGQIIALHNNGEALDLYSCDNNEFQMVRVQRVSGGTGAGVYFRPGATNDTPARANLFHLLSPGHGGVYSDGGGAGTTFPPFENKILFYNPDEDSAPAVPAIGQNSSTFKYSTLYYNTSKRSGSTYFSVTTSADQVISSGNWTKVAFNAVIDDPAFWYDTTNLRWWTRYPGAYLVTASVMLNIAAAAGSRHIQILQNGATSIAHTQVINRGTGQESLAVNASVFLIGTGDFIEVWVQQDSGANATIINQANTNLFMGSRAA